MSALRVITNSEMTTYRRCLREHFHAYVQGYRPIADASALRFGTAWHLGMEVIWNGLLHGLTDVIAEAISVACAAVDDEFERAKLRALLRGYVARWGTEYMDGVVAVESEFRAPLVNPETGAASRTYQIGGKIDVLLADGFVEHKTSSGDIGFGSVYWRKLAMNSQVSTYFPGARALGVEPQSCVYDVVKKPGIKPRGVPLLDLDNVKIVYDANSVRVRTKDGKKWRQTGDAELGYVVQTRPETPDEYESRLVEDIASDPDRYYQRGEVVRLEREEREHALDVWLLTQNMRESTRLGIAPKNTDACERYNSLCPYFPVCSGEASLEDGTRYVKLENVHQELTAEKESV